MRRLLLDDGLHWTDVHRGVREVAQIGTEPLDVLDGREHLNISGSLDDAWLAMAIPTVRRQVEYDFGGSFVQATLEMVFDAFPVDPWLPLPLPPASAITSLSWFDANGAETVVDPADYLLDSWSQPARLIRLGSSWPTGVRSALGGKVRWTAGYADGEVPARALHAMKLLLGHWYNSREAMTTGEDGVPEEVPLGYNALLADRVVAF